MKDKLRREFSLDQSPHFKGLLRETVYSPSLCIVKTNIYRALECVKNVLSWMFTENTWQVFAINASYKCWEWKPAEEKCLWCVWEPASIAKEYALHIPTRLYFSPSCYHEGVAQNLPLLGLGDWGRGGATFQGLPVQHPKLKSWKRSLLLFPR